MTPRTRSTLAVAAWALFLMTAAGALMAARAWSDVEQRSFEYMPDMARSLPYDSFAPNPVMRDGKTLQTPVAGTLARGAGRYRYEATPADAERAGRELRNPIPATSAAIAQGRALYQNFCVVCHGERGAGDGPLVPRIPNPPAYTSVRVREMPPGQIFHIMTRGSGKMPSYAAQITPHQRWLIAHYVATLQGRTPTTPPEVTQP